MTRARARVLRQLLRHRPAVLWMPLAALTAVGLLVLLLGPIAWWATPAKHLQGKDKADARTATRQVLLAAVGGLVLLTGAGFTARTYFLTRRGQFTDRYGKAITHLASDKLTERLGGIYALEHLMVESERERPTVVEVLAAFVREQTRTVDPPTRTDLAGPGPRPATDVQAALTVLARRPDPDQHSIDLTGARLYGARLTDASLAGAQLNDVQLDHADLITADLRGAVLDGASLRHAELGGARLQHAVLDLADLHACRLWQADLRGASLAGARLTDADLIEARLGPVVQGDLSGATLKRTDFTDGADLRQATGLTAAQLQDAKLDEHTMLPIYLRPYGMAAALGRTTPDDDSPGPARRTPPPRQSAPEETR
ncbi:pentapeptide repeat-containing protein [Actinoplanes sp. NPDC049668]|uniref:pentapeptide repeat-containing protein n=1 Tax=unclassified Actinoplanes TaxID=2626549 RepID=UPI0033A9586F